MHITAHYVNELAKILEKLTLTATFTGDIFEFLPDSTWRYLYLSSRDGIYKVNISSWEVIRHSTENADYFIKYSNITTTGKIYEVRTLICQLMS